MAIKKWLSIFLILSLCFDLLVGCSDTLPETKAETGIKQNIETLSKSTKKINPDGTKNEGFYGLLVKPVQANINATDSSVKQIEEPEADEVMHFTNMLRVLGENPERYSAESVSEPNSENSLEIRKIIDEAISGSLKDIMGAVIYSSLTGETVLNGADNYYSDGILTDYALLHYSGGESGMTANIRDAIWASGISWSLELVDRSKQWTNTYIKDGRFMTTTKDGGLPSYHDYWVIARTPSDIICADGTTILKDEVLTRILIYCGSPVAPTIDADGLITVNPNVSKLSVQSESPVEDFEYTIENDEVTITKYRGEGGNVVIPSQIGGKDVTAIGDMAFYECMALIVVVIPVTVVYIGEMAFYGCVNLYVVYFLQIEVIFISEDAFYGCDVLVIICIIETYVYYYCIEYEIYFEITEMIWVEPSVTQPQEEIPPTSTPEPAQEQINTTQSAEDITTQPPTELTQEQTATINLPLETLRISDSPVSLSDWGSMAIKGDGSIWGCGSNEYGNIGEGDSKGSRIPVKIMDDAVFVSKSSTHAIAIKEDGSLWAWGLNSDGKISENVKSDTITTPYKVMDNVVSAFAGGGFTMAITSDGSLWEWGTDYLGVFGNVEKGQTQSSPVKIMEDAAHVTGCDSAVVVLVIKKDGSLWVWGLNDETTCVKLMDNVVSASSGYFHVMMVTSDGSLWAFGNNVCGQLGDGTTNEISDKPVKVMEDVAQVSAGGYYTMIVKTDGSLWACGGNDTGQLGSGTREFRRETVEKVMDNVAYVSTSSTHTMAIKTDGSLWAWGSNSHGQLGDGTTKDRYSPIMVWK